MLHHNSIFIATFLFTFSYIVFGDWTPTIRVAWSLIKPPKTHIHSHHSPINASVIGLNVISMTPKCVHAMCVCDGREMFWAKRGCLAIIGQNFIAECLRQRSVRKLMDVRLWAMEWIAWNLVSFEEGCPKVTPLMLYGIYSKFL